MITLETEYSFTNSIVKIIPINFLQTRNNQTATVCVALKENESVFDILDFHFGINGYSDVVVM